MRSPLVAPFVLVLVGACADPDAALEELVPYYHHVNNTYGEWLNEDKASGIDDGLKAMTLEQFKQSKTLEILTPEQAISKFTHLRDNYNVEHFMMMLPPGLPAERFQYYAQLFADKVIPAFNN